MKYQGQREFLWFLAGAMICLSSSPARSASRSEVAVLAGGCFWGVESVYEHVRGVEDVVSGYAGGGQSGLMRYGGDAGFAEAVRITFDPDKISYAQLLEIFFGVAHDPTQVDRQGPDIGPRYRSAIYPQNAAQRAIAQAMLAQFAASHKFGKRVATRVEAGGFRVAEDEHQDYVRKHPGAPYVVTNDLPKLRDLREHYPQFWKD